ncbi:unnamed protein product [Dovyalis caffra]|uniref:Uncharacterized protein n=1 Tax=Dovyalis caffra TaxID=77055 RepID=A0AAV1SL12_9ROSI|nr:unnamed protein product [Dovyalis caffra]
MRTGEEDEKRSRLDPSVAGQLLKLPCVNQDTPGLVFSLAQVIYPVLKAKQASLNIVKCQTYVTGKFSCKLQPMSA